MACPVCLHNFRDPRILPCLHSVCRSCIDQHFVTAGSAQEIRCPVCRASCRLPDCGAEGLPRDTTSLAVDGSTCDICQQEGKGDAGEDPMAATCDSCHVTLCKDHLLKHMMEAPDVRHAIDMVPAAFSKETAEARQLSTCKKVRRPRLCADHAQPLLYYCTQCDVFVCGECVAIGDHALHRPIVHAAQVAQKTKEKADAQVQKLSSDVKPRLEEALHAVDQVTTQLTTNADQVRDNIRSATQRAVHTVQACGEQLLQQVDDIEMVRHKVLEEQRDSLTTHLNSVNSALQFNRRLQQHQNPEDHVELLAALGHRVANLANTQVETEPCRHANMQFLPPADNILMAKAKETVGLVMSCQASASHCSFEQTHKYIHKEEEVTVVLRTSDSNGHRLTTGGDHITTHWSKTPTGVTDPAVTVEDKKDGTFKVRVKPYMLGDYELQIKVNGENIPQSISFTCYNHLFDENECSPHISLSANKRTATHKGNNDCHASVLGAFGMQDGRHSWQIRVTPSTSNAWAAVGIASKPLPNKDNNCSSSQSFCTNGGYIYTTDGAQFTSTVDTVQSGDTLQFVLDCDEHTLQVTNLRSQQLATIINLPAKEYFLYVNIYGRGGSMELF